MARKGIAVALAVVMTACATRSAPVKSPPARGETELAKIEAQRADSGQTAAIVCGVLFILGGVVGAATMIGFAVAGHTK